MESKTRSRRAITPWRSCASSSAKDDRNVNGSVMSRARADPISGLASSRASEPPSSRCEAVEAHGGLRLARLERRPRLRQYGSQLVHEGRIPQQAGGKIPIQRVNTVINGKRGVTPEAAILLAGFFETTAGFWMEPSDETWPWRALPQRVAALLWRHETRQVYRQGPGGPAGGPGDRPQARSPGDPPRAPPRRLAPAAGPAG